MKALTREQFIIRAKNAHGNKYDYSKVKYVNNQTKVAIICPIHGEFWQTPNNHLGRKGCPKCRNSQTSIRCRYTTEEFIKVANNIHNGIYDYSKVNYVTTLIPVEIVCHKHGSFWQIPNYHISGCGCPKCGIERIQTHRLSNSKLYKVHRGIEQRCNNPNHSKYNNYGGRGITICKEWLDFGNFNDWALANGYKDGLTIDRIDVNGNYEPSNCRWIPRREQYYNMTKTRFVNIFGRNISIVELNDKFSIKRGVLIYYLNKFGDNRVEEYIVNKFGEKYAKELILYSKD